jgi:hypothetical protein
MAAVEQERMKGGQETSRFSRRVGSGTTPPVAEIRATSPAAAGSVWTLRLLPLFLAPPVLVNLVVDEPRAAMAGVAGIVLFLLASRLVQRGMAAEAEYGRRGIAKAPRPPMKLLGSLVAGAATFVFAGWGSQGGMFGWGAGADLGMGIVFAGLTVLGCLMAYGMDPTRDKGLAPEVAARAGVRSEQVIQALAEAEAKIRAIEASAARLRGSELKSHLARIVDQARAVIAQLERDPKDLSRARRFLVTYLDGTRDVVSKYVAQQGDLGDTPLADNFRRVLGTIEQVFLEQEELLKQDERLDLDVKIEVLETQLKREGVT